MDQILAYIKGLLPNCRNFSNQSTRNLSKCSNLSMLLLLLRRFSHVRLCTTHRWQPTRLPVPGILQARTLQWVAISFSNVWKWKVKGKSLSHVRLQRPHGLQPTKVLHPWDFPGKSTGVGCHCLLRIYPYERPKGQPPILRPYVIDAPLNLIGRDLFMQWQIQIYIPHIS